MKERIRQLRKTLALNQADFGARIGVKQGTIASYENGVRTPLTAVIGAICREFDVNEEWLRNGTGEMFKSADQFDLTEYAKTHGASDLELELVRTYFGLPQDFRDLLMKELKRCVRGDVVAVSRSELDDLKARVSALEEEDNAYSGIAADKNVG